MYRSILDPIGITDVLTRVGQFVRQIADAEGITDNLSRSKGLVRLIQDGMSFTDVISWIRKKIVDHSFGLPRIVKAFTPTTPEITTADSDLEGNKL
jgi:hypothetical protein